MSFSFARCTSSSVAFWMSTPRDISVRFIVSTISVSMPTCPANAGSQRSANDVSSRPVLPGSYAMPVMPPCHGMLWALPGSYAGSANAAPMFAVTVGSAV